MSAKESLFCYPKKVLGSLPREEERTRISVPVMFLYWRGQVSPRGGFLLPPWRRKLPPQFRGRF
jgi:hypothetical protein